MAGTTPVVVTTTNLPGALAFSIPMEAAAQGSVYEKAMEANSPEAGIIVTARTKPSAVSGSARGAKTSKDSCGIGPSGRRRSPAVSRFVQQSRHLVY